MNIHTESPSFFENKKNGCALYGVDYLPATETGKMAYLFLQPLGTERNVIDAFQVSLARELASKGVRVLRFDYFGTGDSEGSFSDITFESLMSDVGAAIQFLGEQGYSGKIGLFGLRFGTLIAGCYAEEYPESIGDLILCAPVVKGYPFIYQELMQSLSTQMVLFKEIILNRDQIIQNLRDGKSTMVNGFNLANLNGFPLTRMFLTSTENRNLIGAIRKYRHRCLIIEIDKIQRKMSQEMKSLNEHYKECASFSFLQVLEKSIPWIHGNYLIKNSTTLNEVITQWIMKCSSIVA
jgi:hypothetical protein